MPSFEKRGGRAAVVPTYDPRAVAGTIRAIPLCGECVDDYRHAVRGAPYRWKPVTTGLLTPCEYCGDCD
jgi:hypothetical protein